MHSLKILRLRRHLALLILGACAGCISIAAQAGQTATGKKVSQPVAAASDVPRLQTSYALAGMPDDEDCFEDYGSQLMQTASISAAASAMSSPPMASQSDKPALSAAQPQSPTAVPLALAPIAAPPAPVWEIALTDKTLNGAIARWTTQAGWQLRWEMPVDYAVEAHTTVSGTFVEAVETVARSMETAEVPMKAIFYKGNKVLRIVPRGGK